MTSREKTFVLAGISFLGLLLVIQFIMRPAMERTSTLRRVIAAKSEALLELRAKRLEYRRLKTETSALRFTVEQQGQGSRVLSVVERIRQRCGLSDNGMSLKPLTVAMGEKYQETAVEMRFDSVTMAQLVQFLSELESVEFAGGIKSLEVRRAAQDNGGLKVTVQVAVVSCIR